MPTRLTDISEAPRGTRLTNIDIPQPADNPQPVRLTNIEGGPVRLDSISDAPTSFLRAREDPGFFKAFKENFLFPASEGFGGGRFTKPSRVEKFLFRPLSFLPRVAVGAIGRGIESISPFFGGATEPILAAFAKEDISELTR